MTVKKPITNKTPKTMRGAEQEVIRNYKKLSTSQVRQKYLENNKSLQKLFSNKKLNILKWTTNRGLRSYNLSFKSFFKESNLVDFITNNFKNKKIKILDEGMGQGRFLTEIKEALSTKNYEVKTTGITIDPKEAQNLKIDKIHLNPAERYLYQGKTKTIVPLEKQHLIFSLYGSFQYSIPEIQKNVLLKTAYSLEKGGCAFIGFIPTKYDITTPIVFLKLLLNKKKLNHFYEGVRVSFEKRGFEFKYKLDANNLAIGLFIKRLK